MQGKIIEAVLLFGFISPCFKVAAKSFLNLLSFDGYSTVILRLHRSS